MLTNRKHQSSADYTMTSLKLSKGDGEDLQIRNIQAQLTIYENIERPYLTGELLIVDSSRIYDGFDINGVEDCEVQLQQPIPGAQTITLNFVLRKVLSTQKTNDQTEAIAFKLIEKSAFDNQLVKFSASYTGNPADIITNIMKDRLNEEIDGPEIPPAQSDRMKVVIPYWNAMQACDWVRDRASTSNGMPYFLYKTMNEPEVKLKSLEELLAADAWNPDDPFRFSKAFTNSSDNLTDVSTTFIVENYSTSNKEDTLKLIENGAFSSDYGVLDLTTGRRETFVFEVGSFYEELKASGIVATEDVGVTNTDYSYNGVPINQLPSKYINRIVMNSTYDDDFVNYYEEDNVASFKLDAVNHAVRNLLFKASINIRVPGIHFLSGENKSIGRQIEFFYHNNDVSVLDKTGVTEEDLRDRKRSGKFMIYSAKHTFYDTKHTVDLTAVKSGHQL
jgi:hypothetical protein